MIDFVSLVDALDATTSANEKVALIRDFLLRADPADAAWAVYLLTDQRKKRTVSSGTLREIFLRHTSLPEWLFTESHAHVGDTAETVTLLIRAGYLEPVSSENTGEPPARDERALRKWMEEAIPALACLDQKDRYAQVVSWWRGVPEYQLFVLNKLLTGGFRLGVSRATVVKAIAGAAGVSAAVVTERITGGFTPGPEFLSSLKDDAEASPRQPYPFYLASPLPDEMFAAGPLSEWHVEWKWDGIRAQIIRRSAETAIWSRGEELVTEQFPDIAEAAAELPDGTVLDAELLAWGDEGPRPFHALQRRLGRKKVSRKMREEVPALAMVFDCLEAEGRDIRERPLEERLAERDRVLASVRTVDEIVSPRAGTATAGRLLVSEAVDVRNWQELEELRRSSRERKVEGFLLKRRGSPYRQGRKRGDWWKFKRDPMTLDAVLIYAQAGSGKRANLFTDYTFALRDGKELVPFAKAYSGLSDQEIAELDRWIRRNTTERFGPVRQVAPERVFEIAFEDIVPSTRHKSGVATRFPRILRPRPDKPVSEIDSLEDARRLIQ